MTFKEWDESKHPRDDIGRFTYKNGGSVPLRGDKQGAAEQFGMWVRKNGKILQGLVKRRQQEKELFMTP